MGIHIMLAQHIVYMLTNTCQQYTSCLLPLRRARDSPHFRGLLCPPRPLSPSRFRSVFEERASKFPFCISCTHWGQTILKTFRPVVSGDSELNLLNHAKAVSSLLGVDGRVTTPAFHAKAAAAAVDTRRLWVAFVMVAGQLFLGTRR